MPITSPKDLHLLLLFSSCSLLLASASPSIGVTYHHTIPGLPSREHVISALLSAGVTHVHLPDPDSDTIRSFSYTGVSLLLSLPNSLLPHLASNRSTALQWLHAHVLPFHPRARITTIALGHDVLSSSPNLSRSLLPAIRNVNSACLALGLRKISISTVHSFDLLTSPFPPSTARFQESTFIKPLLNFLSSTNSSFLIDLYPFKLYRTAAEVPIGYAMFDQEAFDYRDDPNSGLRYRNLFDAMVDATISALSSMGHRKMPVVVTGTGWPSSGAASEREASVGHARRYNQGLVGHVRSGLGTPMRREGATEVYIHELFDDLARLGLESERHWGILWVNLTWKYEMSFSGSRASLGSGGFGPVNGLGFCCWVVVLVFWHGVSHFD